MDPVLRIRMPQNVPVEFVRAGLGARTLAYMIDLCIVGTYFYLVLNWAPNSVFSGDFWSVMAVLAVLLSPGITFGLWNEFLFDGQTPGKRLLKLKVVRIDGDKPGFTDYFLRWAFRLVDIWLLTPVVGIAAVILSRHDQRLGDMVAGTTVVKRAPHPGMPEIPAETGEAYRPLYPSVVLLTDRDMAIIRREFRRAVKTRNRHLLRALRQKVEEVTGIQDPAQKDEAFIRRLIRDYEHLTQHMDGAAQ
ncbi:MAG: RDD family protein [Chlorobi bacterium]|nr:RDD family protein [Chlorobiota bacterium]